MGQIAHSQEPALQALDAAIRDGLNGTTEGYVYNLVSDAVQLAASLREPVTNTATLATEWSRATAQASQAVPGYNQERNWYQEWYGLMNAKPSSCFGTGADAATCHHDGAMVVHWWEDYPEDPSLGPPATVAATVSSTSLNASFYYNQALQALTDVLTDAGEVLLQARNITGDAHDYPGNKEIEAIVQVIGEHNIAREMAQLVAEATNLRPHLQAQIAKMDAINGRGRLMAGLVGVGVASMVPPPPIQR